MSATVGVVDRAGTREAAVWRRVGRAAVRLVWLGWELSFLAVRYAGLRFHSGAGMSPEDRAAWLRQCARRVLRVVGGRVSLRGSPPRHGLLISNHLSYLDIVVLAATLPAVFVSKKEVRRWPVFGWFAAAGGTLFVDRQRRQDVARLNELVRDYLERDVVVVIFPEGTSSDGSTVLPFRSALLQVAVGGPQPLSAVGITYTFPDGSVADDVCWWGDMTLAGHLPKLLSRSGITATLVFAPYHGLRDDRKLLARELQSLVLHLRDPESSPSEP